MSKFEEYLDNATKLGPEQVIPGCVCLVANKDGIIYEKSSGNRSIDPNSELSKDPLTVDTTMWIASCTKLMTAISVMQCVEKGLLDLDADISILLPEWKDPNIIKGFDEAGKPIYEKVTKKMTLRQLCSHSSGLGYIQFHPTLMKLYDYPNKKIPEDASLHDIAFTPLLFEPGTQWNYGVGLEWAGQLVEKVNPGLTLSSYMSQHIWQPLGMTSTTFRPRSHPDISSRMASATYRIPNTPQLVPFAMAKVWPEERAQDFGGAGAYSTPGDYIKLLTAMLRNDGTLLKPESMDELFKPVLSPEAKQSMQTALHTSYPGNQTGEANLIFTAGLPRSSNLTYGVGGLVNEADVISELNAEANVGWGQIGEPGKIRRSKGSLAWSGLPNLHWVVDRKRGLAIFYASQVIPPGDRLSAEVFARFEEAVFGKELGLKL